MKDILVLPIFWKKFPEGVIIDTTSNSGQYKDLSPFILGPIDTYISGKQAKNFENLWQYSKVYKEYMDGDGNPSFSWYSWRDSGWSSSRAVRYPMGKGTKPEYSFWDGEHLSYIDARKRIYAPIYVKYVIKTDSFQIIKDVYESGEQLILLDYDAYDYKVLGMTLKDVINNPNKKCGHAFVLAMILEEKLEECIND